MILAKHLHAPNMKEGKIRGLSLASAKSIAQGTGKVKSSPGKPIRSTGNPQPRRQGQRDRVMMLSESLIAPPRDLSRRIKRSYKDVTKTIRPEAMVWAIYNL